MITGLHPFQPAPFDVYFGASPDFPAGGSVQTPQIIKQKSISSAAVQTKPKTRYYWAVDTSFGNAKNPGFGPIFSFVADNLVPTVKAGDDAVTWLKCNALDGNDVK